MIPVRIPWTEQPPAGTGIDWGNPLTNGLVLYTTANECNVPVVFGRGGRPMQINQLASGTFPGTFGTNRFGKGFDDRTNMFLDERDTFWGVATVTEFSTLWVGDIRDTGSDRCLVQICSGLDNWFLNGFSLVKDAAVSGTAATEAFRFRISGSIVSTYESVYLDQSASVGPHVVAAGIDAVGETADMWVDGKGGAATVNGDDIDGKTAGTDIDQLNINSDGSDATPNTGITNATFWWNRKLNSAELRTLSDNPWQIFEPRTIWYPFAGAPAAASNLYFPVEEPWTKQPPPGTPIDWTNPLAEGLHHCWNFGSNTGLSELVTGQFPNAQNVNELKPNAVYFDGTSGHDLRYDDSFYVSGNKTLAALFRYEGSDRADEYSLFNNLGDGSSGVEGTQASTKPKNGAPVLAAVNVPSSGNTEIFEDGASLGTNSQINNSGIQFRYDALNSQYEVYVGFSTHTTKYSYIGGTQQKTTDRFHGDIYFTACWLRVLTANEHKTLAENPWQIFQPRTVWYKIGTDAQGGVIITVVDVDNDWIDGATGLIATGSGFV